MDGCPREPNAEDSDDSGDDQGHADGGTHGRQPWGADDRAPPRAHEPSRGRSSPGREPPPSPLRRRSRHRAPDAGRQRRRQAHRRWG